MRYQTRVRPVFQPSAPPKIGDIRHRVRFVVFPTVALDGYTYFLCRVIVKEQYERYLDIGGPTAHVMEGVRWGRRGVITRYTDVEQFNWLAHQ